MIDDVKDIMHILHLLIRLALFALDYEYWENHDRAVVLKSRLVSLLPSYYCQDVVLSVFRSFESSI